MSLPPSGQLVQLPELVQSFIGLRHISSQEQQAAANTPHDVAHTNAANTPPLPLPRMLRSRSVRVTGVVSNVDAANARATIAHRGYELRIDLRLLDADSVSVTPNGSYSLIGELYHCGGATDLWGAWTHAAPEGFEAPWVALSVRVVVDATGLDMDLFEQALAVRRLEVGA